MVKSHLNDYILPRKPDLTAWSSVLVYNHIAQ